MSIYSAKKSLIPYSSCKISLRGVMKGPNYIKEMSETPRTVIIVNNMSLFRKYKYSMKFQACL